MICLVTEYVAANCSVCGKPACPVHVVGYAALCPSCRGRKVQCPSGPSNAPMEPCQQCKGKGTIIEDRFFDTEHCPIKHRVNIHSAAERVA
jgi:hypothetical protein